MSMLSALFTYLKHIHTPLHIQKENGHIRDSIILMYGVSTFSILHFILRNLQHDQNIFCIT